jgi:hypothetical protein
LLDGLCLPVVFCGVTVHELMSLHSKHQFRAFGAASMQWYPFQCILQQVVMIQQAGSQLTRATTAVL